MAAALRIGLILDLERARAGALIGSHGALGIKGVAEAGVGVDDDGQLDAVADEGHRVGHLGGRGEADVRPAEPRVGDGGAREVHRLEARRLGERGGQRIVDAGGDEDGGLGEPGLEGRVHAASIGGEVMRPPGSPWPRRRS